jgi:hypothetical protein
VLSGVINVTKVWPHMCIIRGLLVELLLEQANRALFEGKRQGDGFSAFTAEDVKLAFENFNRTHGYKGKIVLVFSRFCIEHNSFPFFLPGIFFLFLFVFVCCCCCCSFIRSFVRSLVLFFSFVFLFFVTFGGASRIND